MEEYFCPNCQAILNDQWGFDPNGGTWTCTQCGQLLMDDDIYDGDNYEGVAWYCDKCGALLNRQYGFSDNYGSWTCTECWHTNSITEDDIIEGTRFGCPNCYATLNNQLCFNQYLDDGECTECGAKLHHNYSDDEYTVVEEEKLKCPNCGDILSEQLCYFDYLDDWTCTECGAHLHHDYSDEPYDIVEDENGEYNSSTNINYYKQPTYTSSDTSSSYYDSYKKTDVEQTAQSAYGTKISEGDAIKKRIKAFLFKRKKIEIGYDYTDLLRKNIAEVQTKLYNKAFNNMKTISVKDIYVNSPYTDGEVEQVIIGGSSFFQSTDKIPYDTEIIITYHEKKEITIPFSAHSLKKKNYHEVAQQLQSLGFTEIYERSIKDLITGWVTKDGSIESVTIGESSTFKKNTVYKYDVKIVIEYHTFKSKK